jgi:DNA-directed RNA polymerase subunit RPC12/RpoP
MSPYRKVIALKVIDAPPIGPVVRAPPVLKASDHTIDYTCGKCGTLLLHAELDQIHNLNILCTKCGSYNSTDV